MEIFFHKSFSPDTSGKDFASGASTEYNSKYWNFKFGAMYVGENFRSDLGFIRRTDVFKISPKIARIFWPKSGPIQQHSLSVMPFVLWKPELDFEKSDQTIVTSWNAELKNTARLEVQMYNRFTHLYYSFDPTGTDGGIPLPENENYNYTSFKASYNSDMRKNFSYRLEPSIGQFYNGKQYSLGGRMSWRIQPYFSTSIQINYDKINLPDPYPDASIWLIGPKFDITFNKNVFWATFIQYSNQRDNFSINTRLQWRFAPLSDLFVVYNDNYFTDNVFAPRVRSFNVKLSYWLNI